eukprot:SM000001S04627  [mRNA]  locus=s1:1324061:1338484:+ [translate_table: standard]
MGHQGSEHGPKAGARAPAALPEAAAATAGEADATSRSAMHSRSCSCFDSESDYFCNLHIDVEYLPPSNDASGGHVSKLQPGGGLAASGTSKENPAGLQRPAEAQKAGTQTARTSLPPLPTAVSVPSPQQKPSAAMAGTNSPTTGQTGQAPSVYPEPQAPQLAAAAALQPGQPAGPGFVLNVSTMHVNASTGNVSAIRRRIAQGEDVNAISYELVSDPDALAHISPVVIALRFSGGQSALHIAAGQGRTATVQLLLEAGAKHSAPDDGGLTALHFAAANGHSATVVALLKAGADKEARTDSFQTPLHIAAGHGRTAAVEKLLQHKADIDAPCDMGQTALHLAAALGQTSTVALLLKSGANKEARDDGDLTPLHGACETGRKATVSVLLSTGADLEAKDKGGQTPLHLAASKGFKGTVEFLLQHAASLTAVNDFGMTPLHMAARNGKTAVVSVLLDQGDDKERTTDNGQTPLHLAAAMGRTATVDLLVRQGCNINVEDDLRQIPLHLAAASPQLTSRVVEKLLQHGARMDAQDDLIMHPAAPKQFGRTPVQVAMEQGGTLLLELFSSTLAAAQIEHHGARKQHEVLANVRSPKMQLEAKAAAANAGTRQEKEGAVNMRRNMEGALSKRPNVTRQLMLATALTGVSNPRPPQQVGEAVEAALQRLGCPHALQAHQLQGLDYAAILPVAAWLLKRAQRTRKDRSKKLESYAIHRFHADLDNASCSLEERAQLLAWEKELYIVGVPPTVQQEAQQPAEEVSASSCLGQERQLLGEKVIRSGRLLDLRSSAEARLEASSTLLAAQVEQCKEAVEREHAVRLAAEEAGVGNHDLEEVVRLLGELQGMRDRELDFKSTCRSQRAELQDSIHMLREAGNSRERSLQEVQAEELLVRKLLDSRGHYRMHNVVLSLSQFAAKEISLLSSIQSQFEIAMSSPAGCEKFLESMQAIVTSVEETLQKMSRKVEGELLTLAALQEKQSAELAARSTYASLVNEFQEEFLRHELLQKQLQVAATSASLSTEG